MFQTNNSIAMCKMNHVISCLLLSLLLQQVPNKISAILSINADHDFGIAPDTTWKILIA